MSLEIPEGTRLSDAAQQMGIDIPTLCHRGDLEHFTSCMLCVVKDRKNGKLIPSCTAKVSAGMDILTDDDETIEARKVALELLLSEHAGDCEAPCRLSCPAFMDIPLMNRLIANGDLKEALEVVMKDIALPGVLGRICPAPCESACKRKPIDDAVSICLLKRFAADAVFPPPILEKKPLCGKNVAVVGAGPAGLSAAFYLQTKGIQAVVYDKNPKAGGALQYAIPDENLDKSALDKEISFMENHGVQLRMNTPVDALMFTDLCRDYDAVVIATGDYNRNMDDWGLKNNGERILVEKGSYRTQTDKVFAVGNVNRSMRIAIRSAAQGKEVATAIEQFLSGDPVVGEKRPFNSVLGKLLPEEFAEYMKEGTPDKRQSPKAGSMEGFSLEAARQEAARCLHCDCRKPTDCKLRTFAGAYHASQKRFAYSGRKPVKKLVQQNLLIYEPGKCIRCGICVRITAGENEALGLTFIGRGFDVEIGVPFNESLSDALRKTARRVTEACPTGALVKI